MSAARAIGGPVASVGTPEERAMAKSIAGSYLARLPKNVLAADILQAALIGLWDGIQKHGGDLTPEQRRGYLVTRIRGQIIDELRAQDWLPRRARKAADVLRPATIVRFDDLGRADDQHSWEERLPSEDPSPEDECMTKRALRDELGDLKDAPLLQRHHHILRGHYWQGRKFKELGAELGVSEPRISQQHAQAILTLRAWQSGELPRPTGSPIWQGTQIRREARLAIERKHRQSNDHRDPDRRTGDAPSAATRPGPFPCAVPKRWLGGAPAAAAGRPVPRGAGRRELVREAREDSRAARPEAALARPAADPGGGLAVNAAALEPAACDRAACDRAAWDTGCIGAVPSVLPEEGLALDTELLRYRDWMIAQALLRTDGNRAQAAKLLGLNRTTLVEILKRTARGVQDEQVTERLPEKDPRLEALALRVPWDDVARLRSEGVADARIIKRLGLEYKLDAHRFTVEKVLRLPRPIAKCGP